MKILGRRGDLTQILDLFPIFEKISDIFGRRCVQCICVCDSAIIWKSVVFFWLVFKHENFCSGSTHEYAALVQKRLQNSKKIGTPYCALHLCLWQRNYLHQRLPTIHKPDLDSGHISFSANHVLPGCNYYAQLNISYRYGQSSQEEIVQPRQEWRRRSLDGNLDYLRYPSPKGKGWSFQVLWTRK